MEISTQSSETHTQHNFADLARGAMYGHLRAHARAREMQQITIEEDHQVRKAMQKKAARSSLIFLF